MAPHFDLSSKSNYGKPYCEPILQKAIMFDKPHYKQTIYFVCTVKVYFFLNNFVPGLGPNIFSILAGLQALSRHSDYHLHAVHITDTFSHIPCMNLVHSILSAVPLLKVLVVSFHLKPLMEWSGPEESSGSSSLEEIPGKS